MGQPVVVVDHVSKKYRLYRERNASIKVALMRGGRAKVDVFWALEDVSFQVEEGSTTAPDRRERLRQVHDAQMPGQDPSPRQGIRTR